MKFNLKPQKNLILIIALVIVIIAGGIFWWWKDKKDKEGTITTFEPPEHYVIQETPEGKIVENKKAGLSFKVPEGWNVEISGPKKEEGIVEASTKDTEFYPKSRLPQRGCGAEISIEYRLYEKETQSLTNLIKEIQTNPNIESNKDKEVININSYPALKRMVFYKPEIGQGFWVEVPAQDGKVYVFSTFFPPTEKERCSQEFNKFLEGVLIKPK